MQSKRTPLVDELSARLSSRPGGRGIPSSFAAGEKEVHRISTKQLNFAY